MPITQTVNFWVHGINGGWCDFRDWRCHGYFVGGIIEAEEKYHNLEEAIRELTKTRQLLSEDKDRITERC
ncbi:hypothetical protein CNMCM8980_008259 [Aspergillus fumigatiaffinis]|nr:hypothetical protein CNMCM6457_003147 [Aspergillus fumigatiaffinis]KAF4246630.1 hypothetical protein CNMCM8980_008259 [Aspergillus fumigatiaffinis]